MKEINEHVHGQAIHALFNFKYRKVYNFSFRDTP